MSFLQLKKAHHINKKVHFKLGMEPTSVIPEKNRFGNDEYHLNCTMLNEKGFDCAPVNGSSFKININQVFTFKCSYALYNAIAKDSEDGEELVIIMREHNGKTIYEKTNEISKINVLMASEEKYGTEEDSINPAVKSNLNYGYESVKHRDLNRSDEIKWGMCINNATKIGIALLEADKITKEEILSSVGQYTHDLMHLAYALPDWLKHKQTESINKKEEIASEEIEDEQIKKNLEDLF
tara:strand:+ start:230 stop:943 length:714 start_codon:yes stop_codon:yes gene_type:complete